MNSCDRTSTGVRRSPQGRRALRGFTLPELVLAAAIGAALLTAVAASVGSMTQTVAYLVSDSTDDYDKALARIARDVRYAWWVDSPSPMQLRVADNANRVTEYFQSGDSLFVRLPSGDEGSVAAGLSSITFALDSLQRLRENPVRQVADPVYTITAPPTVDSALKMLARSQMVLGFIADSDAGPGAVDGIDESLLTFQPTRLDLRVARVTATGNLRVDFYLARAPGDARPRAGATSLGGFDVSLAGLPLATTLVAGAGGDVTLATYAAPTDMVPLAVPTLASPLSPGTSYSVVLTVGTGAMTVMAGHLSVTGTRSDMQSRDRSTSVWAPLAYVVPFQVNGDKRLTATAEYTVASAVHTTLVPTVGSTHTSSAPVYSQTLASDPWLGVVPGESSPDP